MVALGLERMAVYRSVCLNEVLWRCRRYLLSLRTSHTRCCSCRRVNQQSIICTSITHDLLWCRKKYVHNKVSLCTSRHDHHFVLCCPAGHMLLLLLLVWLVDCQAAFCNGPILLQIILRSCSFRWTVMECMQRNRQKKSAARQLFSSYRAGLVVDTQDNKLVLRFTWCRWANSRCLPVSWPIFRVVLEWQKTISFHSAIKTAVAS